MTNIRHHLVAQREDLVANASDLLAMFYHACILRIIDFRFAALSKASAHNYRSCLRKWYRIGTWVQLLADPDARVLCGIGGISDTGIRIGTTLFQRLIITLDSNEGNLNTKKVNKLLWTIIQISNIDWYDEKYIYFSWQPLWHSYCEICIPNN